ncbi:mammalian ependymin-related protein 1 [Heteronotia binoei]|uniref:mammalian ependymin-related protein 1 n=1 Tax=Heteronotia binoei TaxID=13085 RepID=UPI002931E40D|nr:mammalian ependymin-related protein 1 [Heteronotia binoei]
MKRLWVLEGAIGLKFSPVGSPKPPLSKVIPITCRGLRRRVRYGETSLGVELPTHLPNVGGIPLMRLAISLRPSSFLVPRSIIATGELPARRQRITPRPDPVEPKRFFPAWGFPAAHRPRRLSSTARGAIWRALPWQLPGCRHFAGGKKNSPAPDTPALCCRLGAEEARSLLGKQRGSAAASRAPSAVPVQPPPSSPWRSGLPEPRRSHRGDKGRPRRDQSMTKGVAGSRASPARLLLLPPPVLLWSVIASLACRSLASAQQPVPCQAPVQWEGRTVRYDHNTGKNIRALVTYDGPNQRLRVLEEKKGLIPCKKFFEYIYLYKDEVMFQIEQVTKLCSKMPLTEPWDPYDIPDNSTYEDQYYIGGPSDQIMVQEWSDRKPARKFETWVGVYTMKDCYPVQETYTRNYSMTTSTRFFDLKLGISDPSVFTPPSTCQKALPKRMSDEC